MIALYRLMRFKHDAPQAFAATARNLAHTFYYMLKGADRVAGAAARA